MRRRFSGLKKKLSRSRQEVSPDSSSESEVEQLQDLCDQPVSDSGQALDDPNQPDVLHLSTRFKPSHANHSFNGVTFWVVPRLTVPIAIVGFIVGGELGKLRCYVSEKERVGMLPTEFSREHDFNEANFEKLFERTMEPSAEAVILLDRQVILRKGDTCCVYIHSACRHDRGLNYQSYPTGIAFAHNDLMHLIPGAGHTSPTPFDMAGGWFRRTRGLAGSVLYKILPFHWEPNLHLAFPTGFQRTVLVLLMIWRRPESSIHGFPIHVLYEIMTWLPWHCFGIRPQPLPEAPIETDPARNYSGMDWWDTY